MGRAPPDSIPNISVRRRNWKLTVQRQKLFLKIIFITNWGHKVSSQVEETLVHAMSLRWASQVLPGSVTSPSWALIVEVRLLTCGHLPLLSGEHPILVFPFHPMLETSVLSGEASSLSSGSCGTRWAAALWMFTLLVMYILNANIWWM